MIKRHWIQRYMDLPPQSERLLILQSWDTANKGGPENDFSVCTTWVVTRNRRWYLIDVWRKRVDYPNLKAVAQYLAATHKAQRVLVEDAGAGTSLVQELRAKVSGIIAVRPDRDKPYGRRFGEIRGGPGFSARARVMARRVRNGALRIPRRPERRPVRFREPSAVRGERQVSNEDLARGYRPLVAALASDAI